MFTWSLPAISTSRLNEKRRSPQGGAVPSWAALSRRQQIAYPTRLTFEARAPQVADIPHNTEWHGLRLGCTNGIYTLIEHGRGTMDAIWTLLAVLLFLTAAIGAGIWIRKSRAGSLDDLLEPEKLPTEPVLVAQFANRHEAEIALGYLKDAGINAALFVDDAGGAYFGISFSSPARIMVPAEQVDEAQSILESAGIQ